METVSSPPLGSHRVTKAELKVLLQGPRWLNLKIILSQEKNIQGLNEVIRSLQEQLKQCRNSKGTRNSSVSPLNDNVIELERQKILED
ncbi:hypothetical protein CK203_039812 [Vitis vinifera]|uniref:Uncharacterized protein n=2 Tax=Vitis vinifera TaxID=29760 RepID=A0A438HQD4_VITVI|nr:hypothetical protein CK203_085333 [Vitis vinifera]RVW86655.1 hypothetical protein CK203_039812 [Vitis vinifera]CAN74910.1 hypothetical protein VITISV_008327 [Vitis vinifera]